MRHWTHRRDGWTNPLTGRGGDLDRHASTDYMPSPELDRIQVDALLETNGVARRIVWREPEDAMRPGYKLRGDGLDPKVGEECLRQFRRRWNILGTLVHARAVSRGAGGAGIVILANDGRDQSEPLDLAGIRTVVRFVVRDRWEITPVGLIDDDPASLTYGRAPHYYVHSRRGHMRFHESRIIRLDGFPISDRSRARRDWWGGSVLDLVYAELRNYGSAHEDAAEAITLLTQGIFEVANLQENIFRGNEDYLAARYKALRQGMGSLGDIVIDKSLENYRVESRTFAGLPELLQRLMLALVTVTDMPEVVLIGSRSAGLNGGSEGDDLRGWYDSCGSKREPIYEDPLMAMIVPCLASPDGPTGGLVPENLGIEWGEMWTATEAEKAELRSKRAAARSVDLFANVITPKEARSDPDLVDHYTLDIAASVAASAEPDAMSSETTDAPAAAPAPEGDTVAESAMNGAQIEAVKSILSDVTAGLVAPEAGAWLLHLAVPTVSIQAALGGPVAASVAWKGASDPTDVEQVADERDIPEGEVPVSAVAAAKRAGYNSAGPILRLVREGKIRHWRSGPLAPYRVLMSEVSRALAGAGATIQLDRDPET